MSEQKPSLQAVLPELRELRTLVERLSIPWQREQLVAFSMQQDLQVSSGYGQPYKMTESQRRRYQRILEERVDKLEKLQELLERLEVREQQERPAELEQLFHVGELQELVPLVRVAWRAWSSREALALLRHLEQLAERLQLPIPDTPGPDYEADFAAWAKHQALLVQRGVWEELDRENLMEELEALSRSEHSELESRLEVLITHLLKWQFDAASQDPRRLWRATIREQRHRLSRLLQRSPSLRPTLPAVLHQNYPHARLIAIDETGLPGATFPQECPWPVAQILDNDFMPSW